MEWLGRVPAAGRSRSSAMAFASEVLASDEMRVEQVRLSKAARRSTGEPDAAVSRMHDSPLRLRLHLGRPNAGKSTLLNAWSARRFPSSRISRRPPARRFRAS